MIGLELFLDAFAGLNTPPQPWRHRDVVVHQPSHDGVGLTRLAEKFCPVVAQQRELSISRATRLTRDDIDQ